MGRSLTQTGIPSFEKKTPSHLTSEDLAHRVRDACAELGLPPIEIYPVNGHNPAYYPAWGIVRETSLQPPEHRNRYHDIAYFVKPHIHRWLPIETIVRAATHCEQGHCSHEEVPFTSHSVHINAWVFDDCLQYEFMRALEARGLQPHLRKYGTIHSPERIAQREEAYAQRHSRYTTPY